MAYRGIISILLILAVVATLCICVMKPKMHKAVMVYNAEYVITQAEEQELEKERIPVMEMTLDNKEVQPKVDNVINIKPVDLISSDNKEQRVITNVKPQTQTTNVVIPSVKPQPVETRVITKKPEPKTVKIPVSGSPQPKSTQIDLQKIVENNKNIQPIQAELPKTDVIPVKPVQEQPKTVTPVQATPKPTPVQSQPVTIVPETPKVKVLTAKEEEIAWNVWRSNLQNKLMQDVKLPAIPYGTKFNYTFKVDKYGKITDVKTYATPSSYTPYAIQYIAPVIRSYQGRSILKFPEGTQRTVVEAYGAWKISSRSIYSTPEDYNDVEKVVK